MSAHQHPKPYDDFYGTSRSLSLDGEPVCRVVYVTGEIESFVHYLGVVESSGAVRLYHPADSQRVARISFPPGVVRCVENHGDHRALRHVQGTREIRQAAEEPASRPGGHTSGKPQAPSVAPPAAPLPVMKPLPPDPKDDAGPFSELPPAPEDLQVVTTPTGRYALRPPVKEPKKPEPAPMAFTGLDEKLLRRAVSGHVPEPPLKHSTNLAELPPDFDRRTHPDDWFFEIETVGYVPRPRPTGHKYCAPVVERAPAKPTAARVRVRSALIGVLSLFTVGFTMRMG